MKKTIDEIKQKSAEIKRIGSQYGIGNIRIFGSVARGDAGDNSDVDLLVTLDPKHTLLDLGGFLVDVRDLLHCKVDVVLDDSLNSAIRTNILKEAKAI